MVIAQKNIFLGLLVVAFASGLIHQIVTPLEVLSGIDLAFAALGFALVFLWYRRDAFARGFRRSALLNIMVVAATILAVPYYLFRTRGFSKGLMDTGMFFVLVAGYTAVQWGSEYLVYFVSRSHIR
jgi:hypothetical protein